MTKPGMSQPAQWFRDEIAQGLARLVVLRLQNAPWEDDIAYTQQAWVDTLWAKPIGWDAELDTRRVRTAFQRLAGNATRWPAPRMLIEAMPDRPQRPRLGRPQMSESQRRENRDRLQRLMAETGIGGMRDGR
ncbi:hypothetical protein BTW08_15290 [Salinicola sp. MH3R3-1]|uniref:hypothetical protein n=1 Tax=Salinicola sp. MH3R3-1 TaxID=1928762 RepID=UPI00094EB877|nr:hypothetical protein [Salinicola sp. MH3R3-1]OLO06858.1 hypothetical protein BTW08_15290 [Salinicola sp. MH3R3-1]